MYLKFKGLQMINKEIVKTVWSLSSIEAKRSFLLENVTEEYMLQLNVKAFRNDFYSASSVKFDTLVANMLLKQEKIGVIGSKFGRK